MSDFKDHFSSLAPGYAAHRPHYPQVLFDFLAGLSPEGSVVWDCATGSGQAAVGLARHFRQVIATDASSAQVAQAHPHPRVVYRVATAEASGLPEASIDMVTVAQAAHWFDLPAFYNEARRVLRPGGVIALWGYERLRVPEAISATVAEFYEHTLAGCWPPERHWVENAYRDLPFPFSTLPVPPIVMQADWRLDQLLGYFSTWSAVRRYCDRHGHDPLPALAEKLIPLWGSPGTAKTLKWPTFWKLGRR